MEKTLLTRKELCKRWGLSYNTICNYETSGKLTRNPNFECPMYYIDEIIKIESLKEPNPLSPLERKRLEKRIEDLEKELGTYEEKFTNLKILLA